MGQKLCPPERSQGTLLPGRAQWIGMTYEQPSSAAPRVNLESSACPGPQPASRRNREVQERCTPFTGTGGRSGQSSVLGVTLRQSLRGLLGHGDNPHSSLPKALRAVRHLPPTSLFCSAPPAPTPSVPTIIWRTLYTRLPCLNIKLLQGRTFVHFAQGGLPEGLVLGGGGRCVRTGLGIQTGGPSTSGQRVCELSGQGREA